MSENTDKIVRELGYEPAKSKKTQPQTVSTPQGRDLFQTPNYAVDLLIPFIPSYVSYIWECANGDGKIGKRLAYAGYDVLPTDIRKSLETGNTIHNFLGNDMDIMLRLPINDNIRNMAIITNPPFSLKQKFYEKCREYKIPFALLIPADYSGWIIDAVRKDGAEKIIPTRRIDYITPSGKSGESGHTADFHSMWLTWGFGLGKTETFVELPISEKKNNI